MFSSDLITGSRWVNKSDKIGGTRIVVCVQNGEVFYRNPEYRRANCLDNEDHVYFVDADRFLHLWKPECEAAEELTVSEISRRLGYDVKIVK